jgi:4-hydroxy-3-methylbut-2-en-1-yl diphosphate synthase IspG/GcpE
MLLWSGIGDTIRLSFSTDPVEEVKAGFEILKSLNQIHCVSEARRPLLLQVDRSVLFARR